MDQTQLELDLQIAQVKAEGFPQKKSAQVVDIARVIEVKRQQKLTEIYEAILQSVEHIGTTDQRYK
ncbi:MAG: hypothetical protein Q7T13_16745 [Polaromonas sp.]|nr:hypothetical protein [Polaromonas sp.]